MVAAYVYVFIPLLYVYVLTLLPHMANGFTLFLHMGVCVCVCVCVCVYAVAANGHVLISVFNTKLSFVCNTIGGSTQYSKFPGIRNWIFATCKENVNSLQWSLS